MADWAALTGRRYAAIDAYRCEDADRILVAMGTIADTARAVVDDLRRQGARVGAVGVTAFRPFPAAQLAAALGPARSRGDRRADRRAGRGRQSADPRDEGRALRRAADGWPAPRCLASSRSRPASARATSTPATWPAVFDWLHDSHGRASRLRASSASGTRSPCRLDPIDIRPPGAFSVRGHSIGGLGSITTNKLLATLIGELFGKHVQAYPRYGSEKKGLPTSYNLTIADAPDPRRTASCDRVDLVPLHDVAAFALGDPLHGLVDGGTVFVQSPLTDPAAIWASIPAAARADIVGPTDPGHGPRHRARSPGRHAPRPDLVLRMQGVALVGVVPAGDAVRRRRRARSRGRCSRPSAPRLRRFYGKRGDDVDRREPAGGRPRPSTGVIDVTRALGLPAASSGRSPWRPIRRAS